MVGTVMEYRKKPVVVMAIQWDGRNSNAIKVFCGEAVLADNGNTLLIGTLEGPHVASEGDFIIKGIAGEFYPCKPDVFQMTYEPVIS